MPPKNTKKSSNNKSTKSSTKSTKNTSKKKDEPTKTKKKDEPKKTKKKAEPKKSPVKTPAKSPKKVEIPSNQRQLDSWHITKQRTVTNKNSDNSSFTEANIASTTVFAMSTDIANSSTINDQLESIQVPVDIHVDRNQSIGNEDIHVDIHQSSTESVWKWSSYSSPQDKTREREREY